MGNQKYVALPATFKGTLHSPHCPSLHRGDALPLWKGNHRRRILDALPQWLLRQRAKFATGPKSVIDFGKIWVGLKCQLRICLSSLLQPRGNSFFAPFEWAGKQDFYRNIAEPLC